MDCYAIHEVDGPLNADLLDSLNALAPEIFPPLTPQHYSDGFWFIAYHHEIPCAFAGLVPFWPFQEYAYFKRCLITSPEHYGHGIQFRMMMARELRARQAGYTTVVSECGPKNHFSASNFRKAGFELVEPEQKWAGPNDLYWRKVLV